MSITKVKIGVIGAGSFACLWYLPVLEKHPNVQIQAICSSRGMNAKNSAKKNNILSSYQY